MCIQGSSLMTLEWPSSHMFCFWTYHGFWWLRRRIPCFLKTIPFQFLLFGVILRWRMVSDDLHGLPDRMSPEWTSWWTACLPDKLVDRNRQISGGFGRVQFFHQICISFFRLLINTPPYKEDFQFNWVGLLIKRLITFLGLDSRHTTQKVQSTSYHSSQCWGHYEHQASVAAQEAGTCLGSYGRTSPLVWQKRSGEPASCLMSRIPVIQSLLDHGFGKSE